MQVLNVGLRENATAKFNRVCNLIRDDIGLFPLHARAGRSFASC